MTNREYLNTLDNMHFAIAVIAKVAEIGQKNFNPEEDVFESVNDTQMEFEDWLAEEYKESKEVNLKEVRAGEKFTYKGYEFTKLTDEENSCYCLLNQSVFESEFGETNDWAKSSIRKRLNEFDESSASKILPRISKDDLVEVSLNYYSYKNPNGRTMDWITALSWEEWYAYYCAFDFDIPKMGSWLRSGLNSAASRAYCLTSSGGSSYGSVDNSYAVRPALHFRKNIEVEV